MSETRRPRGYASINGKMAAVLGFRTVENSHFQADTFEVKLDAWQQPDGLGVSFWADAGTTKVEIFLGFLGAGDPVNAQPSDLASILTGEVDDVDIDTTGGNITVTGRDLTGRLIDNKVSQNWPDRTASEIVTDLAGQVGLTPQVTKTSTPTGKYAKDQYSALGRDTPMWDLITSLANAEGFDAYVKGDTLYFGPSQVDDSNPISIQLDHQGDTLTANVEKVKLKRSLTLAKDITVTVLSYSPNKKVPIKAVAKRQGAQKSGSTSFRSGKTSQNYVFRRPRLTQQQATDLAEKILADLSKHERTFSADMVADTTTRSRTKASISGTGTSFDTDYFVDTVTRDFDADRDGEGELSMSITAKNHQVESQPVA